MGASKRDPTLAPFPLRKADKRSGERASNASRGGNAISAAASQIIQLHWLNEENKSDQRIALIGALANDNNSPLGNWRTNSDNKTAVTVLEGMKAYPNNKLIYRCFYTKNAFS